MSQANDKLPVPATLVGVHAPAPKPRPKRKTAGSIAYDKHETREADKFVDNFMQTHYPAAAVPPPCHVDVSFRDFVESPQLLSAFSTVPEEIDDSLPTSQASPSDVVESTPPSLSEEVLCKQCGNRDVLQHSHIGCLICYRQALTDWVLKQRQRDPKLPIELPKDLGLAYLREYNAHRVVYEVLTEMRPPLPDNVRTPNWVVHAGPVYFGSMYAIWMLWWCKFCAPTSFPEGEAVFLFLARRWLYPHIGNIFPARPPAGLNWPVCGIIQHAAMDGVHAFFAHALAVFFRRARFPERPAIPECQKGDWGPDPEKNYLKPELTRDGRIVTAIPGCACCLCRDKPSERHVNPQPVPRPGHVNQPESDSGPRPLSAQEILQFLRISSPARK